MGRLAPAQAVLSLRIENSTCPFAAFGKS